MKTGPIHIQREDESSETSRDEIRQHRALKWNRGTTSERDEQLAVEEPLELQAATPKAQVRASPDTAMRLCFTIFSL